MRLFEVKSIQYDNWRLPNEAELSKELSLKQAKPYAKELGLQGRINCWDSWENIQTAVKNGKIIRLPYSKYDDIIRLSPGSTLKSMRDMSLSYRSGPRDPFRIANGFEDNDAIPMAIIMDVDGDLILTAGNTRLSCAKICNITPYPKVLIIPGMVSMNEAFNLKTLGLAAGMTAASIGGYNHYNNKVEEPNISINEPNSIDNPSKVSNEQLNRICKSSLKRMPESIHGLLPDSEWNKIKFIYKDSDVAGYYDLDNPYTIVISDTRIIDAVVWHESLHFAQMKLYPKVLNGMKNFKYESKYGDQNNKYLGMDDLSKAIGIANNLRASGKSMKDLNVEAQAELVTNYGVYKYLLDNERDPKYIKIWKSRLETFTPWIQDYKDPFWKNNMKPSDVSLYEKIMNLLYRIF